ncbi:MAG: cytochrome c [Phycisphaerae bacterium]
MLSKTFLTVGLISGCVWGLVLVAQAASVQDERLATGPYSIVAPVHALMTAQSHHLRQIKDLITNESAEERFENMENHAFVLAELCNINAFRATKADYRAWAVEARDQCLALAQAAEKKDTSRFKGLFKEIRTSCKSCHDQYQ